MHIAIKAPTDTDDA